MKFHEAILLLAVLVGLLFLADRAGWLPRSPVVAATAVPQVIYIPIAVTAVPAISGEAAAGAAVETWAGAQSPQEAPTATPWARLMQGCSPSRGTCPQGEP